MPATTVPCIIEQLRRALRGPLPGVTAQQRMAPLLRALEPEPGLAPCIAAVLAPLYVGPEGLSLLFTLRPQTLSRHAGQVSFPGGRRDLGDADYTATALRETEEELGIAPQCVEVLGGLTPLYIQPSHTQVYPLVGWLPQLPALRPNAREVAKVLEAPVSRLLDPETRGEFHWEHAGQAQCAPCYRIYGLSIWGATAMMVSELLTLLGPLLAALTPDVQSDHTPGRQ